VEAMIVRGAQYNLANNNGETILHYAIMGGNMTVLEVLFKHNAGMIVCVTL